MSIEDEKFEEDDGSTDWEDETRESSLEESGLAAVSKQEDAYLVVLSGTQFGNMVKVLPEMTIGRSDRASFQTPDDGISRLHVRLTKTSTGAVLAEDLKSRNGTFVNGTKISSVILKDGDKIRIGTTTILKFSYGDKLDQHFQQQMYNAALRDPLTQVYNRRYFAEHLETEFSYSLRHHSDLCLMLFDIDHFKTVNDTHGHLVGDAVLAGLVKNIKLAIRREDLLVRYGGEEFILLCRGTSGRLGLDIANRIRALVEGARLVPDHPELMITVSAGLAALPDKNINNTKMLLDAADKALYQAKHMGRNRVYLYGSENISL